MSPPQWIFTTPIPGLGIGMLLSTMQIAVQAAAKEEHAALAALAAAMVPEMDRPLVWLYSVLPFLKW